MEESSSSQNDKPSRSSESLYQVFHCFICMDRVKNAHLCPNCSKLCCFQCINRWLVEKSHCPHCRHRLQLSDLVNCRWAEDFAKQLDELKKLTIVAKLAQTETSVDKPIIDICQEHQERVNVFCWTCKYCICHQCALWSGKHTSHTFKPLEDVYDIYLSGLKLEVLKLRSTFMELYSLSRKLRKHVHSSISEKNEVYRDLHSKVSNIIDRFEYKVENQIFELITQQVDIDNEVEKVDNLLSSIERDLHGFSKAELIISKPVIEKKITDALAIRFTKINKINVDFNNELVPNYETSRFLLTNFSILQRRGDPIFSEPLHANGLCWRLKVYPDGNGIARGTYLSVFLELNYGPKGSLKYEYRIEMMNQSSRDDSDSFTREFTSDYEMEESWGYNRFFRLDLLSSEGFLDTKDDTLLFRLHVRNPTYYEKCRDQKWYISELMTLSGRSRMKTNTPEDDNETFLNDAISLSEEEVNYPRPSGSRDFRSSNRNVDSVLSPISVRRDFHLHEDLLDEPNREVSDSTDTQSTSSLVTTEDEITNCNRRPVVTANIILSNYALMRNLDAGSQSRCKKCLDVFSEGKITDQFFLKV